MKDQILKELLSEQPRVRVVFATVAMGMGVDISSIRQIIHIGPPRTVREYMQETGRAGRDGGLSTAVLHYNNRDIGKNRKGISEQIKEYCLLDNSCLRKFLLGCLDAKLPTYAMPVGHLCFSFCSLACKCSQCRTP